jgi:hypothetical protein
MELEELLQAWKHLAVGADVNHLDAETTLSLAEQRVSAVWKRINDNLKRLITKLANWPEGKTATSEELAIALEADVKTVWAWKRNLGRALHQVDTKLGINSEKLPFVCAEWVEGCSHYHLSPEIRAAVLAQPT